MDSKFIISTVLLSALALTACGGSGGASGSSGATSFTAQSRVTITTANSDEIAAESSGALATSELSGLALRGNPQVQAHFNTQLFGVVAKINNILSLRHKSASPQNRTQTVNCSTSGSSTVVVNDADSTFQLTFNNCVESGISFSGSVTGVVSNTSSTMTFSSFTLSSSSPVFSMSMNGTMIISSVGATTTVNGSKAYIAMVYKGRKLEMGNFILEDETLLNSERSQFTMEINSSKLGGSYKVETTMDLYTNNGAQYPYTGQIKISTGNSAATNPSIQVTVQSSTAVLVEIDVDGDGTYETISPITTWSALEAKL